MPKHSAQVTENHRMDGGERTSGPLWSAELTPKIDLISPTVREFPLSRRWPITGLRAGSDSPTAVGAKALMDIITSSRTSRVARRAHSLVSGMILLSRFHQSPES